MLGHRVGIIELGGTQIAQLHGKGSNWARQLVISHGLLNRVVSMRSVQLTIREMGNLDLVLDALYKAAKKAIEQDGAEVLVLGCTGLIGYADQLCQKLAIPVIDPTVAALKMSELMISANLVHSRLAYPSETDMGIKVEIKFPPTLERY
jgi:allantoin racemase